MTSDKVSQPDREELLREYLDQLHIKPHNTKRLFVVGLVGIVGSGKSTFARQLAASVNLYVGSNDTIRRFLNTKGFTGDHPVQETLQYIAESSGKYLYEHDVSHIIDADLLKFYDVARRNAAAAAAKLYLVKVDCPEAVIRERILQRSTLSAQGKNENQSRADIAEYERRKTIYEVSTEPEYDFIIHSDQPPEPQLEHLCDSLRSDGVID